MCLKCCRKRLIKVHIVSVPMHTQIRLYCWLQMCLTPNCSHCKQQEIFASASRTSSSQRRLHWQTTGHRHKHGPTQGHLQSSLDKHKSTLCERSVSCFEGLISHYWCLIVLIIIAVSMCVLLFWLVYSYFINFTSLIYISFFVDSIFLNCNVCLRSAQWLFNEWRAGAEPSTRQQ